MGRTRSTGIDLLRGFLALLVFGTHLFLFAEVTTGAPTLFIDGTRGMIDVFMPEIETHPAVLGFIVLSGYCIHRNGLRHDDSDVPAYGIRRAFRILPVYFLAIAVGVACFTYAEDIAGTVAQDLTGTESITAGGLAAKVSGYAAFVPGEYRASYQGNVPLVTVMAEIWLYVVYAVVCVLLLRRAIGERWLWAGIAGVWLAGLVWVNSHPGDAPWWHNASVVGFLPYWWLGAKLNDPAFAARLRSLLPLAVAGWLALTALILTDTTHSIFAVDSRMLLLAAVFGCAIVALDTKITELAERPSEIGKAGYSIYALHLPLMYVLYLEGLEWWLVGAIALAVPLVVYRIYERPLWRLGRRLGKYRRERSGLRTPDARPSPAAP